MLRCDRPFSCRLLSCGCGPPLTPAVRRGVLEDPTPRRWAGASCARPRPFRVGSPHPTRMSPCDPARSTPADAIGPAATSAAGSRRIIHFALCRARRPAAASRITRTRITLTALRSLALQRPDGLTPPSVLDPPWRGHSGGATMASLPATPQATRRSRPGPTAWLRAPSPPRPAAEPETLPARKRERVRSHLIRTPRPRHAVAEELFRLLTERRFQVRGDIPKRRGRP